MIEKDKIYRISEAAEVTTLSISTLRRRIRDGRLKKVSASNEDIRIWGSELLKLMGKENTEGDNE